MTEAHRTEDERFRSDEELCLKGEVSVFGSVYPSHLHIDIGEDEEDIGCMFTVAEARALRDWLNSVLPAREDTAVSQFAERLKDRICEIKEGVGAGRYAEGASMERAVCNPVLDAVIDAIDEELT